MTNLRQAAAGGWHDAARMEAEPDLVPIRSRPDFQALMMDLPFRPIHSPAATERPDKVRPGPGNRRSNHN
jgi:hypothetical protein